MVDFFKKLGVCAILIIEVNAQHEEFRELYREPLVYGERDGIFCF